MTKRIALVAALAATAFAAKSQAAESASAQIALQSQVGSTYNYSVTLHNTGTTTIGSFWFAWIIGQDYLDSPPTAVGDPANWTHSLFGSGNASDGTSIQWDAGSGASLAAGGTLSGFTFSTPDTPAMIAGFSASHPGTLVGTSFIYAGAPLTDAGFEFVATTVVPEPASCGAAVALVVLGMRRKRQA